MTNFDFGGLLRRQNRLVMAAILSITMIFPVLNPVALPIPMTQEVLDAYNFIQSIPAGSRVLVTTSMYGAVWPELGSPGIAVLRHLFRNSVKVILLGWYTAEAPLLIERMLSYVDLKGKVYGVDWVNLGYLPGDEAGMVAFFNNFGLIVKDYLGNPASQLQIMRELQKVEDVYAAMELSGSIGGLDAIVRQISRRTPFMIAGVMNSFYTQGMIYYSSGQSKGLLSSTLGAAKYETLTHMPGPGTIIMGAMSLSHLFIVGLIIVANILYFGRRKK